MTTLTADLSRLQKERDIEALIEIRNTMEEVRDSVHSIMQKKQDCWMATNKENNEIKQIKANIELVNESIAVVLNIK